ncbi:MAG: DUF485 domain-containing protein [Gammaproteobacteria bacterium]
MDKDIRSRLFNDERIRKLVTRKQRYVFSLALLVLAIHFGLVLTMAWLPDWLSARLTETGIETRGLLVTFILILAVYVVMFVFVRRKIAENNADIHELVETISNE